MSYLDGKGVACDVTPLTSEEVLQLSELIGSNPHVLDKGIFESCFLFLAGRYKRFLTHSIHMMPLTFTFQTFEDYFSNNLGLGVRNSKTVIAKSSLLLEHAGNIRTEICGMFPIRTPVFEKVLKKVYLDEDKIKSLGMLKIELLRRTNEIFSTYPLKPSVGLYFTHNLEGGGMCGSLEMEIHIQIPVETE